MTEIIATSENGRYRVSLEVHEGPENPRRDYDHVTHVITQQGTIYIDVDPDGGPLEHGWNYFYSRWDRDKAVRLFVRWARMVHRAVVVEDNPHEGPRALWYMTPEQIAQVSNTPEEAIAIEIREYRAWAAGEVYGYIVEKSVDWKRVGDRDPGEDDSMTTWEEVESCWGLIGWERAKEEALRQFEPFKNEAGA